MPAACPLDPLLTRLDDAIAALAGQLRRRAPRWWEGASACDGWTRAGVVAHLVAGYATAEHQARGVPPRLPASPARDDVLVDQLVVCGRELVATLRSRAAGERVDGLPVEWLVARLVAETVVHGWDATGVPPDPAASEAALGWLAPARTAAAGFERGSAAWSELMLLLTGRGVNPGPWEWERPA